jgi:hypothetical protein
MGAGSCRALAFWRRAAGRQNQKLRLCRHRDPNTKLSKAISLRRYEMTMAGQAVGLLPCLHVASAFFWKRGSFSYFRSLRISAGRCLERGMSSTTANELALPQANSFGFPLVLFPGPNSVTHSRLAPPKQKPDRKGRLSSFGLCLRVGLRESLTYGRASIWRPN